MVEIKIRDIGSKPASPGRALYYLLVNLLCPETNRIEYNGKAMTTIDIAAYANFTNQELSKAIRELYSYNIILNIRAKGKDFYYMNPEFACDNEVHPCVFDWLVDLFEQEPNSEDKELVYFKKSPRKIKIDIGGILPK